MKLSHQIAELVSEFSGLNKTPSYKPVRNCVNCQSGKTCGFHSQEESSQPSPGQNYNRSRRQSLNIAVGVDEIPVVSVTPPNGSTSDKKRFAKYADQRRQSAPCLSVSTDLKRKLNRLRRTNSSGSDAEIREEDEEFPSRVQSRRESAASYRVVNA